MSLRLLIAERHDVDLSVHSVLFTYLVVRHVQQLALQCRRQNGFRAKPAQEVPWLSLSLWCLSVRLARRRVVQLLCPGFGLAEARSQISALLPASLRDVVSSTAWPTGKLTDACSGSQLGPGAPPGRRPMRTLFFATRTEEATAAEAEVASNFGEETLRTCLMRRTLLTQQRPFLPGMT